MHFQENYNHFRIFWQHWLASLNKTDHVIHRYIPNPPVPPHPMVWKTKWQLVLSPIQLISMIWWHTDGCDGWIHTPGIGRVQPSYHIHNMISNVDTIFNGKYWYYYRQVMPDSGDALCDIRYRSIHDLTKWAIYRTTKVKLIAENWLKYFFFTWFMNFNVQHFA